MHYKSKAIFKNSVGTVDKESGIIKDIVIVQEGIDKDQGFFTPEFINALVEHGNSQSKGVKSRFGHPNMCKTTLGTFIGRYKNFKTVTEDKLKATADLHLDQITKKTQVEGQGISMWDYITDMAETNPDMFGNSIHFNGGAEWVDKEIDGQKKNVEEYTFDSLIASDLVDSPAATDELFKGVDDFGVLGTQFLDENPEIFKALDENPELVNDFFKRYKSYSKLKQMSILKTVKKAIGVTKDVDLTLANGDIVTVLTDSENPQVGDRVVDSDGAALADGEHLLPDGGKMIIEGGAIKEMVDPKEEETEEETKDVEELNKSHNTLKKEHETLKKDHQEQGEKLKELEEAVELLAGEVTTLRKSVKSNYKPPKEEKKKNINQGGDDVYDKFRPKKEEDK